MGATSMTAPSYVHGATAVPLIGETLGQNFDRTVARWGDRPALVVRQQGLRWSYCELGEKVDAFAAGLIALGLLPGERIGIWSLNTAEWVITQFATAKAGLILVNINPAYRLAELEYALNKVECRALITATSFKTSDYIGMINTLAPELRWPRWAPHCIARVWPNWGRSCSSTMQSTSSSPRAPLVRRRARR